MMLYLRQHAPLVFYARELHRPSSMALHGPSLLINSLRYYLCSLFPFQVAGNAMKVNLTQLGPLVLPLSEQLRVVWSIVTRAPKR